MKFLIFSVLLSITAIGCSSLTRNPEQPSGPSPEVFALKDQVKQMQQEISDKDNRIAELEYQLLLKKKGMEGNQANSEQLGELPVAAAKQESNTPKNWTPPKSDPEFASFLGKAATLIDSGRYTESIQILNSLQSSNGSNLLKSQSLFLLGEAHLLKNNFPKAIESFQNLVEKYPASGRTSDALIHLSQAHQKMGDSIAAAKYKNLAHQYFPKAPAVLSAKEMTEAPQPSAPGVYDVPLDGRNQLDK